LLLAPPGPWLYNAARIHIGLEMSFMTWDTSGNLAARMKAAREAKTAIVGEEKPVDFQELYALRARILGVLIRDARLAKGASVEEAAASLGILPQTVTAWELGQAHPSLPELELLAHELGVPVSHFWATETFTGNNPTLPLPQAEYVALRNRVVGALLGKASADAGLTPEMLAEKTGIPIEKITAYEMGQAPIPLTELTSLASATHVTLNHFLESGNRVGRWLELQENFKHFSEMPEAMQTFLSNPVNASFIELAMWFSELGVEDLRGIAESILHLSRLEPAELRRIAEGILNNITL
jgi:transcriptional regulator with XRE-family HTH domain